MREGRQILALLSDQSHSPLGREGAGLTPLSRFM